MRIFSRRRTASPAASKPIAPGKGYSLLDSQLSLTGDLETTGSLRIEGSLDGSVLSADSVVVGVGSKISGDIHAREVVVGGTITGNVHASELNGRYRREINLKMREIYEEAVINEGLGAVDNAKDRWRKILESDHPDGEYYKKARNKLKSYGNL